MTVQSTLSEYQAGKLEVLEILEAFVEQQMKHGRKYYSAEQLLATFKSIRYNLEEKWK